MRPTGRQRRALTYCEAWWKALTVRPGGRLRKAAAEISTTDDGRQTTFSHALKNEEKNITIY